MENNLTFSKLDIALKKLKVKKSLGPDHITNEMLTHLVCFAKKALPRVVERKDLPSYERRQSRHQS